MNRLRPSSIGLIFILLTISMTLTTAQDEETTTEGEDTTEGEETTAGDEEGTTSGDEEGGSTEAAGSTTTKSPSIGINPGRIMTLEDDDEPILQGEKVILLNGFMHHRK